MFEARNGPSRLQHFLESVYDELRVERGIKLLVGDLVEISGLPLSEERRKVRSSTRVDEPVLVEALTKLSVREPFEHPGPDIPSGVELRIDLGEVTFSERHHPRSPPEERLIQLRCFRYTPVVGDLVE